MKAIIEIYQIDENLVIKDFKLSKDFRKYLEAVIGEALGESEELIQFLEEETRDGFHPEFGVTITTR